MIGLEKTEVSFSEHLEDIRKMGFDYACDDIDPLKFKYQNEDEKKAFIDGYEEGLETVSGGINGLVEENKESFGNFRK